ncbi:MAG: RHS repeat protein, partial [Deltaproteobacteria bacterium]|nr:RHS repeat protein [Deltaproteobacteria bacterium]
ILEKIKSKTGVTQWLRTFADGKKEFFNERGLLIRKEDPNKNFLNLEYDPQGRLAKVTDLSGRQITFSYAGKGLVESVTNPLGKKCTYKYDKEGNLIYAQNARGYDFTYQYNPARHMTEVIYMASDQKEIMKWSVKNQIKSLPSINMNTNLESAIMAHRTPLKSLRY